MLSKYSLPKLFWAGVAALLVAIAGGFLVSFGTDLYNATKEWLLSSNLPITIPQLIFVLLAVGGIALIIYALRHKPAVTPTEDEIERIERVHAYIFFPIGTPEENKNLDYHKKYYHKKLIVNSKTKIPQAYILPAAETCYGWRLVHKYPDLWTSEEDSIYPNPDIQKWCDERGYHLNPWSASKKELLESDSLDVKSKEIVEQEQFLKEKSSFEQTKTELLQALYFFPEHWGTYKKLVESMKLESPQSGEIKWCSDQIKSAIVRARMLNLNEISAVIPQIEATSNDMALLGVDVLRFPRSLLVLYGNSVETIQNLVSRGDVICERVKQIISVVEQAFQ